MPRPAVSLPDDIRQKIAAEMNLSETAFVECHNSSEDDFSKCTRFNLRWFTPTMEVPLCGHATLAAAAAIFSGSNNPAECIVFNTRSGELSVTFDPILGQLSMDLPLLTPSTKLPSAEFQPNAPLLQHILSEPGTPTSPQIDEILYEPSLKYLVISLKRLKMNGEQFTRFDFASMKPDVCGMHAAHDGGLLVGVVLTLPGRTQDREDFYYRFFGPWAGIDEDPVTGSALSVLGPYWAGRLQLGESEMLALQCSERKGDMKVVVKGERGRVTVTGKAFLVVKGELFTVKS